MLRGWVPGPLALVVVASLGAVPARAGTEGEGDLAKWIATACPKGPDFEVLARLDQVAGKAVTEGLRAGKYRDSVRLATAYLGCLERFSSAGPVVAEKIRALQQVQCFVPLAVFESEGQVDAKLADDGMKYCPTPPPTAPAEAAARVRWGEEVRRYAHLLAAARPPADVLPVLLGYMKAFGLAGMAGRVEYGSETPPPAGAAVAEPGPGAQADERGNDESEAPDPVFAVRVFTVAAAVAAGRLDALLDVAGGAEMACRSPFLAALGVLQAIPMPRESALPLILHKMLSRASLEARVEMAEKATKQFAGKDCAIPALVSALGLGAMTAEAVDAAVAAGKADMVARLAAAAPPQMTVPGAPASRVAVMDRVVAASGDARKGGLLCDLGDARLDAGMAAAADDAYAAAAALLTGNERMCATAGRFRAALAADSVDPARAVAAAREFAGDAVPAQVLLEVLRHVAPEGRQADAVRFLWDASAKLPADRRAEVSEALVKLVDEAPGTPAASAAIERLPENGAATSPEERAIWHMVVCRHHVLAKDVAAARRDLAAAVRKPLPKSEDVVKGMGTLARWLAAGRHFEMVDEAVRASRKAKLLGPGVLAELAGMVGEVGERARAAVLLKAAEALGPSGEGDWLAIASAYARVDEAPRATAALNRLGPQKEWGPAPWMVKGRIETSSKHYRDAAAAYGKAVEQVPGACEPRFFRGLVRLLMGDPEEAEVDFRKCIDAGDISPQVLGGLGYALFDQSKLDDSIKTFRDALAKDDKAADNHIGLGMALLRSGEAVGAVTEFRRAGVLEPAMAQGYAATERKGYVYSDVEKKAWEDLAGEAGRK